MAANRANTGVRRSTLPYNRPAYAYGGRNYYSRYGYGYHAFQPYRWGSGWLPWGGVVAGLATTAAVVAIADDDDENDDDYYYDQGVYYAPSDGGYTVVQAPIGAVVDEIPSGYETVGGEGISNSYYYGGAYYEKTGSGYQVVQPMAGSLVEHVPQGAEEVQIGDMKYLKYGETYYQPVVIDGKNMYEVVLVE
jgi:hypothetical protein